MSVLRYCTFVIRKEPYLNKNWIYQYFFIVLNFILLKCFNYVRMDFTICQVLALYFKSIRDLNLISIYLRKCCEIGPCIYELIVKYSMPGPSPLVWLIMFIHWVSKTHPSLYHVSEFSAIAGLSPAEEVRGVCGILRGPCIVRKCCKPAMIVYGNCVKYL